MIPPPNWMNVSQLVASIQGPAAAAPTWSSGAIESPFIGPMPVSEFDGMTGVPDAPTGMSWETMGGIVAAVGGVSQAIGAAFTVRAEQSRLKTQSLSLEHEAAMSAITARDAEVEAQSIVQSGEYEIGGRALQAGAEKSERAATMAGRGLQLGVGSAAEVQASGELIKEMDAMAIRINTARGAAAARTRGVNQRNASMFATLSARNVRKSAGNDLTVAGAAGTSLLTSGSQFAYDRYRTSRRT